MNTFEESSQSKMIDIQQWFNMQSPQSTMHCAQLEDTFGWVSNPHHGLKTSLSLDQDGPIEKHRFRKRSTPISCFRYLPNSTNNHNNHTPIQTNIKPNLDESKSSNLNLNYNYFFGKSRKKSSYTGNECGLSNQTKSVFANGSTSPAYPNGQMGTSADSGDSARSLSSSGPNSHLATNIAHPMGSRSLSENSMPQLRLKIQYQTMDVFPLSCYHDLKEFLKTNYMHLICSLESKLSAKQKEQWANCFVNIFEKLPNFSITEFLKNLLQEDLQNLNSKESMIFRSNSIGSKAMECYIKLVGENYLQHVLRNIIEQILVTDDEFEVDVTRFENPGSESAQAGRLDRNSSALIKYVKLIWDRIKSSKDKLPRELFQAFTSLGSMIEQYYGSQASVHFISSCLFLRFICPGIHGPVLFGLASSVPEENRVSRNLTLVAKVLQNLANLSLFEDKESHMKLLNKFVEKEIPPMRQFLRSMATLEDSDHSGWENSSDPRENSLTLSNCHQFIDLGYEFAKLSQLLNSHLNEITITPELENLPTLLDMLNKLLDDSVFYALDLNSELNNGTILNPKSKHFSLTLDNQHTNSSSQSVLSQHSPYLMYSPNHSHISSRSSLVTAHCKSPPYENPYYRSPNYLIDSRIANNMTTLHDTTGNNHYNNDQSRYTNAIDKQTHSKIWPSQEFHHSSVEDDLSNVISSKDQLTTNIGDLMDRYREQMQQLNDCIDKVEKPIDVSRDNKFAYCSDLVEQNSIFDNSINQQYEINGNKINNSDHDHDHDPDHNGGYANASMLVHLANANLNQLSSQNMCQPQLDKIDQLANQLTVLEGNQNHTQNGERSIPNVYLKPVQNINVDQVSGTKIINKAIDSEYDYDYDNLGSDELTDVSHFPNLPLDGGGGGGAGKANSNSTGLSESPSLDQLAERLQELKTMLQLEREEIQQVVASKAKVIWEQEKSIEQLECELDQFRRREHQHSSNGVPKSNLSDSCSKSLHHNHTRDTHHPRSTCGHKCTSRTSPTSSFSSCECCPTNTTHSDLTQTTNNPHKPHSNSNYSHENYFLHGPSLSGPCGPVVPNRTRSNSSNNCQSFNSALNHKSQSFRVKTRQPMKMTQKYGFEFDHLGRPISSAHACDSNLFYLSKASEDMGIPMGHLIQSSVSSQMTTKTTQKTGCIQRRYSETRSSPKI